MSEATEALLRHVDSYRYSSAHRDNCRAVLAEIEHLSAVIQRAHDTLMNLQPHIGQLPKQYRLFVDGHVDIAMEILERELQ